MNFRSRRASYVDIGRGIVYDPPDDRSGFRGKSIMRLQCRVAVAAFAMLFAAFPSSRAQEKPTTAAVRKPTPPEVGLVILETKTWDWETKTRLSAKKQEVFAQNQNGQAISKTRRTVLAVENDAPSRWKVEFLERTTRIRTAGNEKDEHETKDPMNGKTFVVTKTAAGVSVVDGNMAPVDPKTAKAVEDEENEIGGGIKDRYAGIAEFVLSRKWTADEEVELPPNVVRDAFADEKKSEMKIEMAAIMLSGRPEIDGIRHAEFDLTIQFREKKSDGTTVDRKFGGGIVIDPVNGRIMRHYGNDQFATVTETTEKEGDLKTTIDGRYKTNVVKKYEKAK